MWIPVPYHWIDYGSIAVVVVMIIGFIVEIWRGALGSKNVYPFRGPVKKQGKFRAYIMGLIEAVFGDAFYSTPLKECHFAAYYERKTHVKRIAHFLIFYGFILLILSTITGFVFDKWISVYSFIPAEKLGSMGRFVEIGLGITGGLLVLIGLSIYIPYRFRGEISRRITTADTFILLLILSVLSGFLLEISEYIGSHLFIAIAFWIHMAFVISLFASMPYTKASHVLYQIIWNFWERTGRRLGRLPKIPGTEVKTER